MMQEFSRHLLRKTCRFWGVLPDYYDSGGKLFKVPHETLISVLVRLTGFNIESDRDLESLIAQARNKKRERVLEPVHATTESSRLRVELNLTEDIIADTLVVEVVCEDGHFLHPEFTIEKKTRSRIRLELKEPLPAGYHHLEVISEENSLGVSFILVAPKKVPPLREKQWGLFVPYYGIRNQRNWGCGDTTDISELQKIIYANGGNFLGSLPILAMDLGDQDQSPYSAQSKLFWNELLLDVEELARQQQNAEVLADLNSPELRNKIQELRQLEWTDQLAVASLKKPLLEKLAASFFERELPIDFGHFAKELPQVFDYARFRSRGDQVEYEYHLYCQYQMHQKLLRLCKAAHHEKSAGLYLDFPVGVRRGGFDEFYYRGSFLTDLSAGAPPDMIFIDGQNWGFAPLNSEGLRATEYEYVIHSLRQHLRHATHLRIDHAMGLHRIYVVPHGMDATQGTYIRFNSRELFTIVSIEAARSKTTIIGEDLGTVPEIVRSLLEENHCMGMWVFPFEVGAHPHSAIQHIPSHKLACMNTHDMVPFKGFCQGRDLELLNELKILTGDEFQKQWNERQKIIARWMDQEDSSHDDILHQHYLEFLARSPADLMMVNVEDLWGETEPQNIPGTWNEYANWKRKLKLSTDEWAQSREIKNILGRISELRKENGRDELAVS
jgi:4-alpha-glucanotransferase